MEQLLQKIYTLLCQTLGKRQKYSYTFQVYNDLSKERQIKIGNSIEYEFRNTGSTVVIINDQLKLYPAFNGRGPSTWKGFCNKNEMDMTIYEYRFEIIPIEGPTQGLNSSLAWQLQPFYNGDGTAVTISELQVIIKQVSRDVD